jgi:uncharacterized RDD family membrane protein YckC
MAVEIDSPLATAYRLPHHSPAQPAPPIEMYTPSWGRRMLAGCVDYILYVFVCVAGSVVVEIASQLTGLSMLRVLLPLPGLLFLGVQIVLTGLRGQSLGKMALRLRVVKIDGSPCGMLRGGLVRGLAMPAFEVALLLFARSLEDGFMIALVALVVRRFVDLALLLGEHARRIDDYVAGTRVIELPTQFEVDLINSIETPAA